MRSLSRKDRRRGKEDGKKSGEKYNVKIKSRGVYRDVIEDEYYLTHSKEKFWESMIFMARHCGKVFSLSPSLHRVDLVRSASFNRPRFDQISRRNGTGSD